MSFKKQIENSGIPKSVIASAVFPENNYPEAALERVICGADIPLKKAKLLAEIINVKLEDLGDPTWKASAEDSLLVLTKGNWTATMVENRCVTLVKNTKTGEFFQLAHASNIRVSKYVELIESSIKC